MTAYEAETVSSRNIFQGNFISVAVDRVRFDDGREADREVVRHPGAVGVLVMDEEGSILMVRQGRHAVSNHLLEIPAGKLEANEDPWECAKRELEEETGYRCGGLELLTAYYSSPGFCDEKVHVFLGADLEKVSEAPEADGDEPISIEWLSEEEAVSAVFDGRIVDAKTIIAITLFKLRKHPEDLKVEI